MIRPIVRRAVSLFVFVLIAQPAFAKVCERGRRDKGVLADQLQPGRYRLTLVAKRGSGKGAVGEGLLTLNAASYQDRSLRTGEIANDFVELPLMWGWTDAPVDSVGVPLCHEETPPDSADPVFPEILVLAEGLGSPRQPDGAPVLLLATASKRRDGTIAMDDCGAGLFVQGSKDGSFWGVWREWGIVRDGRGTFCLEALGAVTPSPPGAAGTGSAGPRTAL